MVRLQSLIIVSSSSVSVAAVTVFDWPQQQHDRSFSSLPPYCRAACDTASPRIKLSQRDADCARPSAAQVKSACSHVALLRTSSQLQGESLARGPNYCP